MTYNNWKLMDKVDVVVSDNKNGYNAYVVEHGDEKALESAKGWAGGRYSEKHNYTIHTFDNEGFTVTIDSSAGYSSQSGRLSFWGVIVEKDGIKFKTSINSDILVELIKETTIVNGTVQQELLFARKAGTQGLLHKGMSLYEDATKDMNHKATMKSAKKTSNWEIGGVYSSITMADICLGEVWDTMEEYQEAVDNNSWYGRRTVTKLRKTETPKKVLAWTSADDFRHKDGLPDSFEEFLKDEIKDRSYVYFSTGKPPARAKTQQLEVKESDLKILDDMLSLRKDRGDYGQTEVTGRYVREIK